MKNKKYLLLSFATILSVIGMSFSTASFAQSVTTLSCSVANSSVGVNQTQVITASGGNGTYVWSGQNLNVINSSGTQFSVSYPNVGTYAVTVSSAGQTSTCNVYVVSTPSSGNLSCNPAYQNVVLGQTASVVASGGNGAYTWSSPDLNILNSTGTGFSANYASTGLKTLMVASNGLTTSCMINVIANGTVTPGFPNTGGGYNQ